MNLDDKYSKSRESYSLAYYIFCALLFLIPFNMRKVFPSEHTYFSGYFNDYVTYSISITDVLAVMMILIFFLGARHNLMQMFKGAYISRINRIMVMLMVWIFLGVLMNQRYIDISLYQSIRLVGCFAVVFMIYYIINSEKRLIGSFFIISITGVVQSIISIMQFMGQSSIFGSGFLHKLSGESLISRDVIGTSNIIYFGNKFIRSYGTLPHPNILAGYLVFTIIISIYLYIRVTQKAGKVKLCSKPDILICRLYSDPTLYLSLICLQFIGLLLTFSRSGIIAIATVIIINIFIFKIVSRGTFVNYLRRHSSFNPIRRHLSSLAITIIFISLFISFTYVFVMRMQTEFIGHQSFDDRVLLENVSRETILQNLLTGTGIGTYVIYLYDKYSNKIDDYWQFQPDHNSYLLIASEIGIPGMVMYLYLIYIIYAIVNKCADMRVDKDNLSKYQISMFRSIIIGFLVISLFDHYFWTSNQMRMLLWVLFGMFISYCGMKKNVSRGTY